MDLNIYDYLFDWTNQRLSDSFVFSFGELWVIGMFDLGLIHLSVSVEKGEFGKWIPQAICYICYIEAGVDNCENGPFFFDTWHTGKGV